MPGNDAARSIPLWNIANILTIVRLFLVPVFLVLLWEDPADPWFRVAAAVAFFVAAITDRYDGKLARERGLVTDFGKIADPIADKALIVAALVSLSLLGELWWWVTVVIIVRELGITVMRFAVIRYAVIPASRGGKLKTVLQITAIMVYLLPLQGTPFVWAGHVMMGLAVAVTVVTGLDYVIQTVRLVGGKRSPL